VTRAAAANTMKPKKTKVGDVFAIPLEEQMLAFGQVVAARKPFCYLIGFDCTSGRDHPPIEEIAASPILFALPQTFDILLKNGRWPLLGNLPPDLARIPFPRWKHFINGGYQVSNWDNTQWRPATDAEVRLLDGETTYSAMHLEHALQAHYGKRPWHPDFDHLRYNYVMDRR
jgi:hypothetical protein